MKSQTSLVAQHTRLAEWAEQIKECQNRPEGMTVTEWCLQHGITKTNYYWRLRQVRKAFLETSECTSFVEIPLPKQETTSVSSDDETKTIAILKCGKKLSLEITNQASSALLSSLVEVMLRAQ